MINFASMKSKHESHILLSLLLVVLSWSLNGCHSRTSVEDHRLQVADSLMGDAPDSALQMLTAIDSRSLGNDGNRAYHALLLTQARYRCYVIATSDSMINIAVQYYEQHRDPAERFTRALLYKGAVMEELGAPKTAMAYYKRALQAAAPEDYFNQGYIKLRMGKLYQDHFVADEMDITLLTEALALFEKVPDSMYIASTMIALGNNYSSKSHPDSGKKYLKKAIAIAREKQYSVLENEGMRGLADMETFSDDVHELTEAKEISLSFLNRPSWSPSSYNNQLLMNVAYTLARMNKPDSASYYINKVDAGSLSPNLRVFYNKCLAQIALCQGNLRQYKQYYELADSIAVSLVTNDLQRQLREVATKYDNEALKYQSLQYRTRWLVTLIGSLLILSIAAVVLLMMKRNLDRRRWKMLDLENTVNLLRSDASRLKLTLNAHQAMSESLKQTISNQISVFAQLVEQHCIRSSHFPKKYNELFERSYRLNQPNESFWKGLSDYVDSTCNGIITRSLATAPALNSSDINFLSLYCCEIPITAIMACMGYNDSHSVYNKKRRLIKVLALPGKLDDYIAQFNPSFHPQA